MADDTSSWSRLKLGTTVLLATVVTGVAGYVLAGWRVLDAIYMVVITVFGVGYGEVRTIDTDGLRIFTILLIIAVRSSSVMSCALAISAAEGPRIAGAV